MMSEAIQKKCKIIEAIEATKILAVVRTDNLQKTIDISRALIDGGLRIIEITMGFNNAHLAIEELSKIDNVSIAAGSVITGIQADIAISAGAELIVSPIAEINLIKLCKDRKKPIVTAAATPTEAYNAWKSGVGVMKIFPAKDLGGPEYIRDILTPMPFLHLMPTGGVNVDNFIDYLKAGATAVGMGKAFYEDETNFSAITKKTKMATQRLKDYMNNK